MLVRDLRECKEFVAGDGFILREPLHPDKEDLAIHYNLAYAVVKPGQKTCPRKLKSSEVCYILYANEER